MLDKPPIYERLRSFSYPGELFDVEWDWEVPMSVQPNSIRRPSPATEPIQQPQAAPTPRVDPVNSRTPAATKAIVTTPIHLS